ncbi:MAG: DUF58 domain-containing protein [Candidatus Tectomicrobia bacterium]|nr:DUF58 domain-containing protein [Candidatus Tectomicrobia bacterium]
MPPSLTQQRFFDPLVLAKIANLALRARYVVEGLLTGLHDSHFKGFSVEFAEHREYAPGDDLRHLDWKAYAKSDRHVIKQYEEETNLRSYLLLDTSASMDYRSDGVSKFEYASMLAASLAYLMLKQQDAVGLFTFAEDVRQAVPPRSGLDHLQALAHCLEGATLGGRTHFVTTLRNAMNRIRRRGLIIVISDLFDDPERLIRGLQHLRHKKNEVIVFQILDRTEVEFPFKEMTRFEDLEDELFVSTDPRVIRDEYLRALEEFQNAYKTALNAHMVEYALFTTHTPLDKALVRFLSRRR